MEIEKKKKDHKINDRIKVDTKGKINEFSG